MAIQFLRSDWDLNNLVPHDPANLPTFVRARQPGWLLHGVAWAALHACPCVGLCRSPPSQPATRPGCPPALPASPPAAVPPRPSDLTRQDSAYCPGYTPATLDYFVLRSTHLRRLPFNAAFALQVVGEVTEEERELLGQLVRWRWDRVGCAAVCALLMGGCGRWCKGDGRGAAGCFWGSG